MSQREREREQRLSTLNGLESRREQAAAVTLGQIRAQHQEQQRRLEELKAYRDEYRRNGQRHAEQGLSIGRLNAYRQFMAQLDDVIHQQQAFVVRIADEIQQHEQHWRQAKGRQQGMQRLVDDCRQRNRYQDDRREQRLLDDHAARLGSVGKND